MTRFKNLKALFKDQIDVPFVFLLLFVFFLPLNAKVSTILIIANGLLFFVYIKRFNLNVLKQNSLLLLLYLIYIIAYFRDKHEFGVFLFEQKASLLAFPLIFSIQKINKEKLIILFKVLIFSCLFTYLFLLFRALYFSIDFSSFSFNTKVIANEVSQQFEEYRPLQTNYFLGNTFVYPMQTPLMSVLYTMAIAGLLQFKDLFSKKIRLILIVIFSITVFQIFSVIGLIAWFVVIALNTKLYPKLLILLSVAFITLLSVISITDTTLEEKIENVEDRAIIWESAINTAKSKPIVGSGYKTAQKDLESNFPRTGDFGANFQERKLDTHNMYLQILLESGILGLAFLIFLLITFYKKIKTVKMGLICFMLLFLYSMTESILNIYGGLSLFAFIYCLFITYITLNENHQSI